MQTEPELFPLGEPKRRPPSDDELGEALTLGAKWAVGKHHRGRPPRGMSFDDLRQEVIMRAWAKVKHFRHGGNKTIFEFSYMSCYFCLRDIQRENMLPQNDRPLELSLFDGI